MPLASSVWCGSRASKKVCPTGSVRVGLRWGKDPMEARMCRCWLEKRAGKELGETKDLWSRCCVDIRRRGRFRGGAAHRQAGCLNEGGETRAGESLNRRDGQPWQATGTFLCKAENSSFYAGPLSFPSPILPCDNEVPSPVISCLPWGASSLPLESSQILHDAFPI